MTRIAELMQPNHSSLHFQSNPVKTAPNSPCSTSSIPIPPHPLHQENKLTLTSSTPTTAKVSSTNPTSPLPKTSISTAQTPRKYFPNSTFFISSSNGTSGTVTYGKSFMPRTLPALSFAVNRIVRDTREDALDMPLPITAPTYLRLNISNTYATHRDDIQLQQIKFPVPGARDRETGRLIQHLRRQLYYGTEQA